MLAMKNHIWNGTIWVPAPGDAANGLDVDPTRLPAVTNASEIHFGEVGYPVEYVTATPVLDTVAYASGDVMWTASVALTNLLRVAGGKGLLRSITIIDEDDQGIALDLVFLKTNVSLGTVNGVPSISDANLREVCAQVSIAAGDYIDYGGARVAHKSGLSSIVTATASRDVYLAGITRGAPTHTASGLKISIGIENG